MSANRANRGNNSARNWNYNDASNRNENIGWRPALLILFFYDWCVYGFTSESLVFQVDISGEN